MLPKIESLKIYNGQCEFKICKNVIDGGGKVGFSSKFS